MSQDSRGGGRGEWKRLVLGRQMKTLEIRELMKLAQNAARRCGVGRNDQAGERGRVGRTEVSSIVDSPRAGFPSPAPPVSKYSGFGPPGEAVGFNYPFRGRETMTNKLRRVQRELGAATSV